jgi:undecaprenyl diphosphate synthase
MNNAQQKIPAHVAIIMDGNRRWAKAHGLPALEGHRRVSTSVLEKLIERAAQLGIAYLTLWAFSTENWKRDTQEVTGIMTIFRHGLQTMGTKMHKKGIRIKMIGNISAFPQDIQDSLKSFIELTKNNTAITVIFALNYGGRDEIVRAINTAISRELSAVRKSNNTLVHESEDWRLTTDDFSQLLDTAGIPDPDLVIRTGGEHRTSGFLLWQSEYSEWVFPQWYMPDFTPDKLDWALNEFQERKRRFGA